MSRDDDVAWIEARERGVVSDHPRAAVYARLGQAIAALPEFPGDDAWKASVLGELERTDELCRARTARARRRGIVAVLGSSVAIAAVAFLMVRSHPGPRAATALSAEMGEGSARRSTGTAAIGQPITFHGTFAGKGELWIYAGDRLVLRCPGGDGCATEAVRGGVRIDATFRTTAALTHTALLVSGEVAPTGALLADIEAAGTAVKGSYLIDVR